MKSSVVIRESLEGAWKCAEPGEDIQGGKKGMVGDVEIVDLT